MYIDIVVERVSEYFSFIALIVYNTPCLVRVVFRVGDVSVVCSVGNTDYQTLQEKELKLVEEETQRRISCVFWKVHVLSTSGRSCYLRISSSKRLLTSLSVLFLT